MLCTVPSVRLLLSSGLFAAQLKKIIEENRQNSSWMVLIGPEGGWSKSDREIFKQYQVYPVHLGARILRTETAPVAILSILQYELGDL